MVRRVPPSRRVTESREGQALCVEGVLERTRQRDTKVFLTCAQGRYAVVPATKKARKELIRVGWPNDRFAATVIGELVNGREGTFISAHSVDLHGQASTWEPTRNATSSTDDGDQYSPVPKKLVLL